MKVWGAWEVLIVVMVLFGCVCAAFCSNRSREVVSIVVVSTFEKEIVCEGRSLCRCAFGVVRKKIERNANIDFKDACDILFIDRTEELGRGVSIFPICSFYSP